MAAVAIERSGAALAAHAPEDCTCFEAEPQTAMLNEYDVAIVFSGDTDLIPAVEMAFRRTTPRVEIAAWSGAKPLWFPTEMAAGRMLPWCHFLGQQDFDTAPDQAIYIPKP